MRTQHPKGPFGESKWHIFMARPRDSLIKIRSIFYDFLKIRMRYNSYLIIKLIFQSIPTSINRGNKSKLRTLLF